MIARITGRLDQLTDGAALLDVGSGLCYEVRIPAIDAERLAQRTGQEVVLHTIHYLEGDASHGQVVPRLIGFAAKTDRDFFRTFVTVKGVGVRTALQALIRPIAEIAAAIEAKDAKFLTALPGIGARSAERIIAELNGKVGEFAGPAPAPLAQTDLPEAAAEALSVLVQLGERRVDAQALIERVLAVAPECETPEQILQFAYRLKAGAR